MTKTEMGFLLAQANKPIIKAIEALKQGAPPKAASDNSELTALRKSIEDLKTELRSLKGIETVDPEVFDGVLGDSGRRHFSGDADFGSLFSVPRKHDHSAGPVVKAKVHPSRMTHADVRNEERRRLPAIRKTIGEC